MRIQVRWCRCGCKHWLVSRQDEVGVRWVLSEHARWFDAHTEACRRADAMRRLARARVVGCSE